MSLQYSISPAILQTTSPPIPRAFEWASTYLSSSPSSPLLDLSQGVPKDPPHPSVLDALASTSSDPSSARYGPILGEPSFRAAFAAEVRELYHLNTGDLTAEDVSITAGCNQAFLIVLTALCPPGSRTLLPLPVYFNAGMALSLNGVSPIYIPCDPSRAFQPDITAARTALEKEEHGIKMIFLISPNNPTGAVIKPDELEEWFDLAKEKRVPLVIDETYRDFVEGDAEGERGVPHRLFKREDWRGTLISLGSFSSYRIPGHRLGSIAASPELLKEIVKVCDCMQICAPRPPQLALAPLLPSLRPDILASSQALTHRRALFKSTIHQVPGWSVDSIGGFFAYVSYPSDYAFASSVFGKKRKRLSSTDITEKLVSEIGVLCLPGSFFMPPEDDPLWDNIPPGRAKEEVKEDRWLRFSVANIGDDVVVQLGDRLRRMNRVMGMVDDNEDNDHI